MIDKSQDEYDLENVITIISDSYIKYVNDKFVDEIGRSTGLLINFLETSLQIVNDVEFLINNGKFGAAQILLRTHLELRVTVQYICNNNTLEKLLLYNLKPLETMLDIIENKEKQLSCNEKKFKNNEIVKKTFYLYMKMYNEDKIRPKYHWAYFEFKKQNVTFKDLSKSIRKKRGKDESITTYKNLSNFTHINPLISYKDSHTGKEQMLINLTKSFHSIIFISINKSLKNDFNINFKEWRGAAEKFL